MFTNQILLDFILPYFIFLHKCVPFDEIMRISKLEAVQNPCKSPKGKFFIETSPAFSIYTSGISLKNTNSKGLRNQYRVFDS
jgi:hypothetical protein